MALFSSDLKRVYRRTFDAREKWCNILLELNISNEEIYRIKTEFHDNPADCYREGLSKWLKDGGRNWEDLIEALSSPTVGHSDIAESIAVDLSGKLPSYLIFDCQT